MADNETDTTPESNKPSAFISERHRNPNEVGGKAKPAGNYVFAGICALVAFVVYVAIVALQWLDYTVLKLA